MKDSIQIYPVKKHNHWRFRMVKNDETILVSKGAYDHANEAIDAARALNMQCFDGAYAVRQVKA